MNEVIKEIAIKNAGGTLYLVGGAVRDKILQKEVFDKDYCVTGLSNTEFEGLFPNAHIRGKSFPVYDMENCEFALARKELKVTKGHKGFKFNTGKNILKLLQSKCQEDGMTVVLITHNSAITPMANRVISMRSGQVVSNTINKEPMNVEDIEW